MIYNLGNQYGKQNAAIEFKRLNDIAATIELKALAQTRTALQNRALHLFFQMAADALNEIGHTYCYSNLEGELINIRWTKELFKKFTWSPIQFAMYGTDSTTKLKRNEIDPILDSIFELFGRLGIEVTFPNQFSYYIKFYENK